MFIFQFNECQIVIHMLMNCVSNSQTIFIPDSKIVNYAHIIACMSIISSYDYSMFIDNSFQIYQLFIYSWKCMVWYMEHTYQNRMFLSRDIVSLTIHLKLCQLYKVHADVANNNRCFDKHQFICNPQFYGNSWRWFSIEFNCSESKFVRHSNISSFIMKLLKSSFIFHGC